MLQVVPAWLRDGDGVPVAAWTLRAAINVSKAGVYCVSGSLPLLLC